METLRVERLSKDFGGVHALSDVSFSVKAGELLAIIGPNGAGKTTMFNLINGQLRPTSGRIYFFGQDITTVTTHRRAHLGLGRSFQTASLFPNITVIDNTLIAQHGTKRSRFQMFRSTKKYDHLIARAKEMLTSVALWETKDELVKNISYGEQRRLEMVLTTASKPKLLLLDEPSAGLTSAESADITDMIHKLGKDITVLLIAHDIDLVFGVAERIIVLHYGRVIADGTPGEIQADARVMKIYMGIEEDAGNFTVN
jgi:branched-chain amino acid transport system ATP-binding protein